MNNFIARWLGAVGQTTFLCVLLASGTGCGAIKAAANPKVAWAVTESAPMSVVVRRAELAEKTAQNVDRLMTETPTDENSEWLAKVGPETQAATDQLTALRKHELYVDGVRIVAAEVWAKQLAELEKKDPKAAAAAKASSPAAAPAAASAPAAPEPAKSPETKTPETKTAAEPEEPIAKEGKGKKGKGKKTAKAGSEKGKGKKAKKKNADHREAEEQAAAEKAAQEKAAQEKAAAEQAAAAQAASAQAAAQDKSASSSSAKYPSLLAAIDKDLGDEWTKIMDKKRASGELRAEIATLDAANDEKGIAEDTKKQNKARIAELDKQADAIDSEAKAMKKAFVSKARTAAQKTPAPLREKLGRVLVNLRQAVDDANTSNSAALLGYPLAVTSLIKSAQVMARVYAGDVVEERTGTRPDMSNIKPDITMSGGKFGVTVNGLEGRDGKEVVARTTKWLGRAAGHVGIVASTKDILGFEDDVLEALIDGFKAAGYSAPPPVMIPEAPAAAAPQQKQPNS